MRNAFVTILMTGLLLSPTVGGAQTGPQSRPDVRVGGTVWVAMKDGREINGTVFSVSPALMELNVAGQQISIAMRDVLKIEAHDPVWDGVRKGAIAGGITGGILSGLAAYDSRCRNRCGSHYSVARDVGGAVVAFGGIGAGIGALTGALFDGILGRRRLVYSSPAIQ